MYNNVDIISETYEDSIRKTANSSILTTTLQFDDSDPRNAFEYLGIIYIARKYIDLHFGRWSHGFMFVTFHATIFEI